jgi:hypothetical protein
MEAPPYLCSICNAPKLTTNHWQMAITRPEFEGVVYQPIEAIQEPRIPNFTYEELCGDVCSLKHHQHYLDDLRKRFKDMDESEVLSDDRNQEASSHA